MSQDTVHLSLGPTLTGVKGTQKCRHAPYPQVAQERPVALSETRRWMSVTSVVPLRLVAMLPVPTALAFPLAHVPKRDFQELWQKLPQEDKMRVSR